MLRLGWRSLRSAFASIWRMRSRVTLNSLPTSSSVRVRPSSTEEIYGKDFGDIVYGHHIASLDHIDPQPINQKICFANTRRFQKSDNAVGIPNGRNFRGRDNNSMFSACYCILESLFDPRWAIQ